MRPRLAVIAMASVSLLPLTAAAQVSHSRSTPQVSASERVEKLIKAMTRDEKFTLLKSYWAITWKDVKKPANAVGSAAYIPGVPRLGIPAVQSTDAGLGVTNPGNVRPGDGATALPGGQAISGTFDPGLAYEGARMIATEAAHRGFNVLLAGGVNLVRDPRNGRNFEYAGEDPVLAGHIAAAEVKGVQSMHLISTVKHFAANSMETARNTLDSVIDEQPLRESDLLAFEIAIKDANPGSVMCGYNRVNGDHDCQSSFLLTDVLRKDWHYTGFVMSDWGAVYDGDKAWRAGLDQQSGYPIDKKDWFGQYMKDKLAAGAVTEASLDEKVRHILLPMLENGLFEKHPRPAETVRDIAAHEAVSQKIEEAGAVLLKNTNGVLPFDKTVRNVLVVGGHADKGVMEGGGSSAVTPRGGSPVDFPSVNASEDSVFKKMYLRGAPVDALKKAMPHTRVTYLDGNDLTKLRQAAAQADRVVVFVTKWADEFSDEKDLSLDPQKDAMVEAASNANPDTVVVLETGNPVKMPWLDKVKGVLEAWYPGSGGGKAIAGILSGQVNPSGRLTTSWPVSEAQLPRPVVKGTGLSVASSGDKFDPSRFATALDLNIEGANVGYRWFSLKGEQPLYPFGFGLSYTRFEHDGLAVTQENGGLVALTTVKNIGDKVGSDVVQIYVNLPDGSPERLAGYLKVELAPGQTKKVTIPLSSYALARFDTSGKQWVRRAGHYRFRVAFNSADMSGPAADLTLAQK